MKTQIELLAGNVYSIVLDNSKFSYGEIEQSEDGSDTFIQLDEQEILRLAIQILQAMEQAQ